MALADGDELIVGRRIVMRYSSRLSSSSRRCLILLPVGISVKRPKFSSFTNGNFVAQFDSGLGVALRDSEYLTNFQSLTP